MVKARLKDFAPVLLMFVCAACVGVLIFTDVLDIERIPEIVNDNMLLATIISFALFILKGFSGVILYNPLVIMVSLIFGLNRALIINSIGTLLTFSVSYLIGSRTETSYIHAKLEKHGGMMKYVDAAKQYGFVFSFAIHMAGLSYEVLGLFFGMLRIGFLKYLISSFLAAAPGMICFTMMGRTLDVHSREFWIILAVDISLILFGIWFTHKKMRDSDMKKAEELGE